MLTAADPGSGYRPQLDALRAFAVGAVVVEHFVPAAHGFAPFGIIGVRLFFVLSGFLITGILLRCKSLAEQAGGQPAWLTLRQFYVRRFLRIMPVFYLVLFCTLAIESDAAWAVYRWHAVYATNAYIALWGLPTGGGLVFWTLAVEEQFYLVWPWVVLFVPRRRLVTVVVGAIAVAPLVRAVGILNGYDPFRVGVIPLACLDTLGAGALLAIVSEYAVDVAKRRDALVNASLWIGAPSFLAQMLLYWRNPDGALPHITLDLSLALCSVWLIARAAQGFDAMAGRVLSAKPLVYVGTISYGVYLYHGLVYGRRATIANAVRSMVGVKGTLLIGVSAMALLVLSQSHSSVHRWVSRLLPALWGMAGTILIATGLFLSARFGNMSMATMNSLMYLVIATGATLVVASLSWELFEARVNALKRFFPYSVSPRVATVPAPTVVTMNSNA